MIEECRWGCTWVRSGCGGRPADEKPLTVPRSPCGVGKRHRLGGGPRLQAPSAVTTVADAVRDVRPALRSNASAVGDPGSTASPIVAARAGRTHRQHQHRPLHADSTVTALPPCGTVGHPGSSGAPMWMISAALPDAALRPDWSALGPVGCGPSPRSLPFSCPQCRTPYPMHMACKRARHETTGATGMARGTDAARRTTCHHADPPAEIIVETVADPEAETTLARWAERLARLGRVRLRSVNPDSDLGVGADRRVIDE